MDTSNFIIRSANLEDYENILHLFEGLDALHVNLCPEKFQRFSGNARPYEIFSSKVNDESKGIFVAEQNSKLFGFADIEIQTSPPFPMFIPETFGLIHNVFVTKEYRGSVLAKLLFNETKNWARAKNIKNIRLKVYSENARASSFYKKIGFKPLTEELELKL